MLGFIPFFIFGIIVTAILFKIYAYLKKVQKPKEVDMSVPLSMLKESRAVSACFDSTKHTIHNISEAYERMCILDPVKYQNDPTLNRVIQDYKDLLHGKILDPEGKHVPSETIGGYPNPDYTTYLKAQRRTLKLAKVISGKTVLDNEINRVGILSKEEDLRAEFIRQLQSMGIPVVALSALISDRKLNTFNAEQWKKLAKRTKEYTDNYEESVIFSFLSNIDDIEILLDPDKIMEFNTYVRNGAPEDIALEIVQGGITSSQAVKAAKLVDRCSYGWVEAVTEILETDLKATLEKDLRDRYRTLVK